ncbi:cadherin-86C isoform X2 [Anopheles funestus]|uniref:cadherin-86C isoform X2 n=1 Tax=Anopheles funestus TaxID=62324 RepID=UPI0020C6F3C8|nr:cadherin-86C isoform X2 [Anopheles funestus]
MCRLSGRTANMTRLLSHRFDRYKHCRSIKPSSINQSHIKMSCDGVTYEDAYSSTSGRRKRSCTNRFPLTLALLALVSCWPEAAGLDPKFDPSTRMRLVLVPADATVGSVIYRLRASDEEFEYPLQFELVGDASSSTVQIETLPCTKFNSICQANVILTRRLEPGRYYDFQVSVKDTKGGMSVQSCSITATNFTTPHDIIFPHKAGIIMVPEDAKKGTELDYVLSNKNPLFQKPVYLELWGSPLFGIRQKFISPETAEGTIFLLGQLDFEKQAMYHLTVLANDAYAEPGQDTRNIAGLEVVVIVEDVQDVPPVFTVAPPVTRLPAGLIPGDKVLQVHAEDGDKGVPREIRYGLVSEGNPFTSFFDINETSGEISLLRPLDDILALTHAGDPVLLTVIAEEVKVSRDEPPAMATTVQLAFFLPERSNSPPYFENDHYVARLEENAAPGTVLAFTDPYTPRVMDDDAGKNGVFSLTLLGNNGTFEISPNVAEGHANFVVRVRDNTRLDYETATYVHFQILAQELGPATNLSTLVNVTVYLADVNDNAPVFEQNDYIVDLPENMTAGTRVVQVHATDVDTAGLGGRVRYTQILGPHNTSLNLDPASGVVTVAINNHGFDREAMPEYHLYVEARDDDGIGNRAQVPLVIRLIDVNDETPTFEKSLYEFILAADLRNFTVPAFIHATDGDAEAPNNEVRYELIYGNYENKFFLHPITGELKLNAPLVPRSGAQSTVGGLRRRRRQAVGGVPPNLASTAITSQQQQQQQKESDVFVLTARAFDLGVPVRYSTATIRVYPPESRTRTVTFIVPGSDPDRKKVQDTLADITGGRVIIQEVRPYRTGDGGIPTDLIGGGGGGSGAGTERSVVIATILYDADSVVDIAKIQQRLSINGTVTNIISQEERSAILYKAENRVLFWLLIFLAILLALGILTLLLCCICPRCPLNATNRSDMKNKSTKDDSHMHRSRTNLLNADRDMYVEDVDEHDPEYQSLKRIHHHHHHHHGGAGNGGKPAADDVLPIDDDSMRRHEMDRGSDLNYERRGSFKRQGHAAAPQLVAHGDDIEPRDQYFIKDGNAEILRLITRGRNEEENIYVNIPQQQQQQRPGATNQPQYIMVDNGGKEILMRRYIEEQANGKQIIREHYQLLPGTTFIQTIPNEVPVRRGEHVTEVKIGAAQAGRSKMGEQGETEEGGRLKPAVSTHSLMHQELEHSLKQQNALLRQILLEKEKLEERYNQYEQALETQSLPCQSMAVVVAATQTDCDTGTQTDPVRGGGIGGLGRRRTKSENDDSLSEDEYEYVRYSPPDSPDGVYLIKRRRHRKKTKHRAGKGSFSGEYSGGESTGDRKSNRRIIVVESVKRKIRTPIQEEDDELVHHGQQHGRDHHGQGGHRRGGQETRTSILRRKRNEELSRGSNGGNGHGSTSNGKDQRLKRDVLMEISDSLHGEQSRGGGRRNNGVGGGGENRRKKVYRKNVKYYEDSDGSEKEVVVQKNYFSADSLDEITSDVEDYRYSVTKTSKSVTVSPKASVEQRISRRDDKTETTTTRIRLTTSESPSRRQSNGSTGPAAPPPKGPAPKPPRMSKSLSKEEGLNEPTGEQHAVNPKYMDWYYNLGKDSDSLEKRENRKRQDAQPAVGTTTLTTTTTSSTTTITTGGSRKKPDAEAGAKGKPEPAPRTSPPKEARLLKEDIQHARKVAQSQQQQQQHPGSEAGNSHPLLQHSEHRFEAEYGTGPQVPAPPDKLPHYLYPETPPIVSRDNKVQIKIVDSSAASTGPPPQTAAKPAVSGSTKATGTNAKTLNVSTLEDDHDSGIAMNSLLHTKGKRNKIADKKSIFTIAYDDVRIRQIRSESDTPPFS